MNDVLSQNNFIRTMTWQYSAFMGRIFLSNFAAGQTFTVSYRMNALAANGDIFNGYFPAFQTWAAAAINDPFFLSSDPLPQQNIFTFTFVRPSNRFPSRPPPAPSLWELVWCSCCAAGLMLISNGAGG